MMVAEFVARQQTGSPVNGEVPNQNSSLMPNNHQHHHMTSSPSPGTPFLHEGHGSSIIMGQGPLSPRSNSQDDFGPNYDIAAHLKRKELFTQRKQREFIPDNKKDDSYWDRRRRNNEAAKRSREKRRFNDMVLEQRVVELTKENYVLKAQLEAIKDKYNICGENLVSIDQVMATFPSNEQVLSITKRAKLSSTPSQTIYSQSPSPVHASVIQSVNDIESPPPTQFHNHHYTTSTSRQLSSSPVPPNEISNDYRERIETYPNHHQSTLQSHHHHHNIHNHIQNYNGYQPDVQYSNENASNVLNLSRRAPSPYDISSGTGSGTASGDDEHCDNQPLNDANNSLPLKLRHKSHLGDKDAATALLALQHIKQEPGIRASPQSYESNCSSCDEHDSGISDALDWSRKPNGVVLPTTSSNEKEDEEIHLKSKLAKLESEVATIKNMMILNTVGGGGATAAAQ